MKSLRAHLYRKSMALFSRASTSLCRKHRFDRWYLRQSPYQRVWLGHAAERPSRADMTTASPAFQRIDPSILIEEETVSGYKLEHYYPVHIGQVFNERYKTIGKLGYGSASTVWLCRDLRKQNTYTALKVYINSSKVQREVSIYDHINNLRSEHQGRDHVRKLLETFSIQGPHGAHICLVHQPLGMSLDEIRNGRVGGVLSTALVRELFRWLLRGLEYLHQEARVIHTGP